MWPFIFPTILFTFPIFHSFFSPHVFSFSFILLYPFTVKSLYYYWSLFYSIISFIWLISLLQYNLFSIIDLSFLSPLLYFKCTIGWVNFSEFEITVCGSCKMSKKIKFPFFLFNCFVKILTHLFTPLHSKKINYIFANVWKLFKTNLRVRNSKMTIIFRNFTVFRDFLHFCTDFKTWKVSTPYSTLTIFLFSKHIITKFKVLE